MQPLIFGTGTPATTSQMAKDVVTFLNWAAEPEHDERKKTGIKAVILFSTLFAISVYVKRFKWGPIKNRKISACLMFCLEKYDLTFASQSTAPQRIAPDTRGRAIFKRCRKSNGPSHTQVLTLIGILRVDDYGGDAQGCNTPSMSTTF